MFSYRHLLAGCFAMLVGCAGASSDPTSGGGTDNLAASSDPTSPTSRLEAGVTQIGALVEQRSNGNNYLVVAHMSDAAFAARVGPVLTGAPRRAALVDCAVYGGGQSEDPGADEDFSKYLSRDTREEIAASLDATIGDAKVHRIASFGIGDPGDDFSAGCTVAVEESKGKFLALQGHGHDSFL